MFERFTSPSSWQTIRVPRALSLKEVHELREDRAILELLDNMRNLTAQVQ